MKAPVRAISQTSAGVPKKILFTDVHLYAEATIKDLSLIRMHSNVTLSFSLAPYQRLVCYAWRLPGFAPSN